MSVRFAHATIDLDDLMMPTRLVNGIVPLLCYMASTNPRAPFTAADAAVLERLLAKAKEEVPGLAAPSPLPAPKKKTSLYKLVKSHEGTHKLGFCRDPLLCCLRTSETSCCCCLRMTGYCWNLSVSLFGLIVFLSFLYAFYTWMVPYVQGTASVTMTVVNKVMEAKQARSQSSTPADEEAVHQAKVKFSGSNQWPPFPPPA